MKALTYHGPHHVQVENVPDPGIEQADDIILRITATAICGSDLHLFRGKIPQVKHGDIFGHEFMGEVVWGSDQFWAEFVQPGRTCKPCVARGVVI